MAASVLLALAGIWAAYVLYLKRTELPERIAERFSGLHRVLVNKYYVDQIYDAMFVNARQGPGNHAGSFRPRHHQRPGDRRRGLVDARDFGSVHVVGQVDRGWPGESGGAHSYGF